MLIIFIITFLISFLFLSYLSFCYEKINIEKMKKIALTLGLKFNDEKEKVIEETIKNFPNKNEIINNRRDFRFNTSELVNQNNAINMVKKILNFLPTKNWFIDGYYQEVPVKIKTIVKSSGKSKSVYTVFEGFFISPFKYGMKLSKENFFTNIFPFIKGKEIKIGDEEFDKKVIIKGENHNGIINFLRDSQNKKIILDLFNKYKRIIINDNSIYIEIRGFVTDENKFKDVLNDIYKSVRLINKI